MFTSTLKTRYYLTTEENKYVLYLLKIFKALKNTDVLRTTDENEKIRKIIRLEEFDYRLLNRDKKNPTIEDVNRLADTIYKLYKSRNNPISVSFTSSYGVQISRNENNIIDLIAESGNYNSDISKYKELLDLYRKMYSIKIRRYKEHVQIGNIQQKSVNIYNHQVNHILLDEAQDFTLFEIATLKLFYPNASWTLCGDVNQSNGVSSVNDNWDELINYLESKFMRLNICFRSSIKITTLMNNYMSINKYGKALSPSDYKLLGQVIVVKKDDNSLIYPSISLIKSFEVDKTVIIYFDEKRLNEYKTISYFNEFKFINGYAIKGMEFKNVIILDTEYLAKNNFDNKFKYMLVSRALENLITIEDISTLENFKSATNTELPF
jgi:DNA helicase IV